MKNHGECSSIGYLSASSKYFLDGTSTLRYGFEINDFPNLITSGVSENCLINILINNKNQFFNKCFNCKYLFFIYFAREKYSDICVMFIIRLNKITKYNKVNILLLL
jgi:hypothetical protein